jgi:chromate reductase, NAD(P)H dehydrogenase (quinone)
MTTHILGISGSLRRRSYNTALLHAAAELVPEDTTLEVATLEGIPLYNADDEAASGLPDTVVALRDRLGAADALLIATPEYNYSVPGVLKNGLDWLSRRPDSPLNGVPTAVIGAGGRFGTVRAQMHLRQILIHNRMVAVPGPEVLVDSAWSRFDEDMRLTDDRHRKALGILLEELVALARRLQVTAGTI